MTSHRITFEQAVILLIGVGVMLMVEPVLKGWVACSSGDPRCPAEVRP
jgi:hypothetical protein